MIPTYQLQDSRIYFREMTDSQKDAWLVSRWRNTSEARESFFTNDVVTPDTHYNFMRNRELNDLIFMMCLTQTIENKEERKALLPDTEVGMLSLHIDTKDRSGEYGRVFIDRLIRGMGFAQEMDRMLLHFAFEFFNLERVWLEAFTSNKAIIAVHEKTGFKIAYPSVKREGITYMEFLKKDWNATSKSWRKTV